MSKVEEAREIARKLVELEKTRKETSDQIKALKEEFLSLVIENNIESTYEVQNGMVFLETSTKYVIADGLREELGVKSESPDKISQDFVEEFFVPDIKLSKKAKKAIKEDDTDLLSVLVPEEKTSVKIVVVE